MDLLDLSGAGGLPSMEDMMRGSAPVMMPHAPSIAAGAMYGSDQRRHDEMIQQAMMLAKMRASQDAQKAEEMSAAAPGRMAEINYKNQMAQGQLGNVGTDLQAQQQGSANKFDDAKVKQIQNELKKIEPYANAWDKTKSDDEKAGLLKLMVDHGVTFGTKDVSKMALPEVDQMMKHVRQAIANTSGNEIKVDANQSRRDVASITGNSRITVAGMHDQTAMKLKQLGLDTAEKRVKTEETLWRAMREGSLDEQGADTLKTIMMYKALATQGRVDTAQPQITLDHGKVTTTKPTLTAPPDITASKPKAAATTTSINLQKGTVTTPDGKVLTIKQRSKDGSMVKTEDGQTFKVQ